LASLIKIAENLKRKKIEASKLRRQSEKKLEEAKSLARRSSSGLHSVEKKLEDTREKLGEINAEFTHILARKESLERLIKIANDRLTQEVDAREQAQIELENAGSDEAKQAAAERLAQITDKIQELKSEIKQRESASQKLIQVIEDEKKAKSKTAQQIHKQVQAKPTLVGLIKKGTIASERLKRKVDIAERKEATLNKNLQQINEKIQELLAKRRREATKKAVLKRIAKKKALALKRKRAALARKLLMKKKKLSKKKKLARKITSKLKAKKIIKIKKVRKKAAKLKKKKLMR
jgi:hypothetical protein